MSLFDPPRNSLADILYPERRNAFALAPPPPPVNSLAALGPFAPALVPWSPGQSLLGGLPSVTVPARRRVFISFQNEDLWAVKHLRAIAKSDDYDFDIFDESLKVPFNSTNAAYIRGRLLEHINRTAVTICLLGKTTYQSEWVDWELMKSLRKGNRIIVMGIPNETHLRPPRLIEQTLGTWWLWNVDYLKQQIATAPKPAPYPTV